MRFFYRTIRVFTVLALLLTINIANGSSLNKPLFDVKISDSISPKLSHKVFDQLLKKHVSEDGLVNYKGFINDEVIFSAYLMLLSENPPKNDWTKEEKLAFWMNVYNAFTIKLITDNYPTKSIKNIRDAWSARFFKIGDKWYNLHDVEHKALRKMGDPRIHFGINCASFSCPPLLNRAFKATTVNADLEFLTRKFINDQNRNTITEDTFEISKIFQWFGKDFKMDGTLIDYLNNYSDIKIKSTAKRSFKTYDWGLNE